MAIEPDLRVGVVAPSREELVFGSGDPAGVLEFCQQAEAGGLDSVWVGESLFARPRFDPLTLLAAVAARTNRVSLGTAVLLPALRHPVLLAHALATVDRLALGRLLIGVGVGAPVPGTRAELAAVGVPYRGRAGRLVEATQLARRLWRGPVEVWDSRYWPLADVDLGTRPHQAGGPPLLLGGDSQATLDRAGRQFDGWIPFVPDPRRYAAGLARVRAAADSAGRDPSELTPAIYLNLSIDDDAERARRLQRQHLRAYYDVDPDVTTAFQASFSGPPDDAAAFVSAFVDAGARHVVLRLTTPEPLRQLPAVGRLARQLRNHHGARRAHRLEGAAS